MKIVAGVTRTQSTLIELEEEDFPAGFDPLDPRQVKELVIELAGDGRQWIPRWDLDGYDITFARVSDDTIGTITIN